MSTSPRPLDEVAPHARIPSATYRLQFNRDFTFAHALEIIEYLRDLGISDLYASPLFKAGPESMHGYDICSFEEINPLLGGESQFGVLTARLREAGLGLLLDMVPNHMGADGANEWWRDVLARGRQSRFANYFDIDWRPARSDLVDKVLLPVLGDHYGAVLEKGELQLRCDDGQLTIGYHDRCFPLSPSSCARVLEEAAERLTSAKDSGNVADAVRDCAMELRGADSPYSELPKQIQRWSELSPSFTSALESVCAAYKVVPAEPRSSDKLHALVQEQRYRLAFWKVGPEEINYRRFFDLTQLVSLRMEDPEVFQAAHARVFEFLRAGQVTGLRIDHPDGLRDPREYFERLQAGYLMAYLQDPGNADEETISRWLVHRFAPLERQVLRQPIEKRHDHRLMAPCSDPQTAKPAGTAWPLYVVAEKILSGNERLPPDWPVHGTTGYDFLVQLNGLFVDAQRREEFDKLYREFSRYELTIGVAIYEAKKGILDVSLASELNALTFRLRQVAVRTRSGQDFTFRQMHRALSEVIAAFPVYRSYATRSSRQLAPLERAYVERAISGAKERGSGCDSRLLDFIQDLLLLRVPEDQDPEGHELNQEFVLRFQQLSGPVTAKGLEDTAFYNYNRLISLNEVGGDPDHFGVSIAEFHQHNLHKVEHWPHTLLATATHDTKRGEDVRARINVLSEMPEDWRQAVHRWSGLNAAKKTPAHGWLHPNDEYLLYQTLIGVWPATCASLERFDPKISREDKSAYAEELAALPERVRAYMIKALREAKAHTIWTDPDAAYETAVQDFVTRILDPAVSKPFLEDFQAFQRRVSYFGQFNSLAQVLLKATSPGVPDFYQGTELWDFSLVDPDNRRPVDYGRRKRFLEWIRKGGTGLVREIAGRSHTGEIKLYVTRQALNCRRNNQALFSEGQYLPIQAIGSKREHVCAFARVWQNQVLLSVAPRLVFGLVNGESRPPLGERAWQDTALELPLTGFGGRYRNLLTGESIVLDESGKPLHLPVSSVLSLLPVALLIRE